MSPSVPGHTRGLLRLCPELSRFLGTVIILQINRFGLKIKNEIESSGSIKKTLKMTENELKEHIKKLKQEIFGDKISSIS